MGSTRSFPSNVRNRTQKAFFLQRLVTRETFVLDGISAYGFITVAYILSHLNRVGFEVLTAVVMQNCIF
jgi:hypothetical protein